MSSQFKIVNDELVLSHMNFVDSNVCQTFSNTVNAASRPISVTIKEDNQISPQDWKLILQNSNIKKLTLSNVELSRNDARVIGDCLQNNHTLREFIIQGPVTDFTFEVLLETLDKNKTLTNIEFDEVYKTDIRVLALVKMIEGNRTPSRPNSQIVSVTTPMLKADEIVVSKQSYAIFPSGQMVPFFLITALFFLWGVPNSFNDVLIRQFSKSFVLTRFQAGLIQSAFFMGYFLWAIPAALLMKKAGYKAGFVTGLVLYGVGALLFWPAALIGRYSVFLAALFIIASGLSFLETAANPFIAQLGNPKTSEQRLNFSQAFNPLGAITGVLVGTLFIFSGVELSEKEVHSMKVNGTYNAYLRKETLRVINPYVVLAIITFIWAILILITKFPVTKDEANVVYHDQIENKSSKSGSLCRINFIFAVIAQFFYVGAQVGTWSYFIQYAQDNTKIPEKVAGYWLTGTLAAFGVGRFSSVYLMKFVRPNLLMGLYSLINCVLVGIGVFFPGWVGMISIFCTSFFMSLMFPTIFAIGLKGLVGSTTKIAGSIIVMAIVGGAVLTPLMGLIAELTHSIAKAYLLPFVSYLFIALYSFLGVKINPEKM
ncbi:unnamed protein product [Didymodactylos carnosus]|uniref:L-fucose transporter n=1 Tax=Didymodactylos carnosus TaxID=1234261 RepID=A0A813NUT8_9BILA|nr:unnamed protein product [Didymodactylos carnosus]CAF1078368.1 unnamed protein product [Didymodactylos carnosus]CAF3519125.1 unnamed protein product [Didymodactylos carnosus]CAF3841780.1 unnamed protein product [Didymodactylos carnosus]